jgi:hypothetical protein
VGSGLIAHGAEGLVPWSQQVKPEQLARCQTRLLGPRESGEVDGAPHEFRVHLRSRPFATRLRFFGVLVEELGHIPVNRFKLSELHVGEQLSLLVQLVEDRARPLKAVEPFAGGTDVSPG